MTAHPKCPRSTCPRGTRYAWRVEADALSVKGMGTVDGITVDWRQLVSQLTLLLLPSKAIPLMLIVRDARMFYPFWPRMLRPAATSTAALVGSLPAQTETHCAMRGQRSRKRPP
jgi:hypothetical protein